MKPTIIICAACVLLSGSVLGVEPEGKVVALSATLQSTVHNVAGGVQLDRASSARFYRDSYGRTRLENGSYVAIHDPRSGVGFGLDLTRKIATGYLGAPAGKRRLDTAGGANVQSPKPLGTQMIEGFETDGAEYYSEIPAGSPMGNREAIKQVLQVWTAKALQLPLLMLIRDPLSGETTLRYVNVQQIAPDPNLFVVPSDFTIRGDLTPR